jgi:hypothetical protein
MSKGIQDRWARFFSFNNAGSLARVSFIDFS